MTPAEIKAGLRARASQSVPWAGMALSGSGRGAAYAAAQSGKLGVPVYQSGGLLRVASVDIARVLKIDLEDTVTASAKTEEPATITASKSNPTKASSHKAKAAHRTRSSVAAE
ncbi:MAG: hypothetical protein WAN05_15710 [Roseiarcus sp.]